MLQAHVGLKHINRTLKHFDTVSINYPYVQEVCFALRLILEFFNISLSIIEYFVKNVLIYLIYCF